MSVPFGSRKNGRGKQRVFPALCLALVMTLAGCEKSKLAPPLAINGVAIDLPKLQRTCGSSNPTVRDSLDKVRLSIRYADYRTALEELGKLANNPDISEGQKRTINDVSEQVKRAFANAMQNTADITAQRNVTVKPE